jgi:putative ABC transport system ATP-binding protein
LDVFRLEQVGQAKAGVSILKSLDWRIPKGGISTLLGPSGSGKTSLLRLLNRLDEPASGQIYYNDEAIPSLNIQSLRREVGMVFQRQELFEGTVEENILFGPSVHRIWIDVEDILELVGLDADLSGRDVSTLSGGQAQKVSIARALAVGPRVLLLDEPTSGLDPTSTLQTESLVKRLAATLGLTCVFVTHDIEQAKRVGDRAVLLIDGHKVEEGPISQILTHPKDSRTLRFMRGELR